MNYQIHEIYETTASGVENRDLVLGLRRDKSARVFVVEIERDGARTIALEIVDSPGTGTVGVGLDKLFVWRRGDPAKTPTERAEKAAADALRFWNNDPNEEGALS